jgi:hypothetical protein
MREPLTHVKTFGDLFSEVCTLRKVALRLRVVS